MEFLVVETVGREVIAHVQVALAHEAAALGIGGVGHVGDREVGLGDRSVEGDAQAAIIGVVAVDGETVLSAVVVVPGCVGNRILRHAALQVDAQGEEGLAVGDFPFVAEVVAEVGREVRVTQAHAQRVGVVHDGHQLAGGGLAAAAVVEQAHVGVVVEVVEDHGAGREVPTLVCVWIRV